MMEILVEGLAFMAVEWVIATQLKSEIGSYDTPTTQGLGGLAAAAAVHYFAYPGSNWLNVAVAAVLGYILEPIILKWLTPSS